MMEIDVGDSGHQRHGDRINLNSINRLDIHEGMEFESKEEAFVFYKEYAESMGFITITKASRRSRMTGDFIDAKFVCTRYGSKKAENSEEAPDASLTTESINIHQTHKRGRINRSLLKTDCKACLHVKRRPDGRWVVRTLVKEHNHEIFPSQAHHNDCHGVSGLRTRGRARGRKMPISFSRESDPHKKLDKQYGVVEKERISRKLLALENGDAERLMNFFTNMQDKNPFFFYVVDLDEEQNLKSAFWVDAKGRLDYGSFSDVVSVDTTYIENQYKLSLVPFFGVNHHGQFLLLGCGLLTTEAKSEFVWLCRAWIRATGGPQPKVILTNQNKILKETVSEVFPSSRHFFYSWSIRGRMSEKLGRVMRREKSVTDEINDSIYDSCTSEEFEKRWLELVDKFNVRDDPWLQTLYRDREYWVPMYMKGDSLMGISTTQRSDSVISVFDKYIHRKTTLKTFLEQYDSIIKGRCEEESKEEMENRQKQLGLKSPSPFGKQMAAIYTHAIFKKFQVEVLGGVACHPKPEGEEGTRRMFRVQDYEKNRAFVVSWNNESSEVSCSCRLFEYNGFLCRHAMIVLQMSGVLSIPSQYILKRWTKDAKSRQVMEPRFGVALSRAQRYKDLCFFAFKLSEEASLSEESYDFVINMLDDAFQKSENLNTTMETVAESEDPSRHEEITRQRNMFETNKNCSTVQSRHDVLRIGGQDDWRTMEHRNYASAANDCFSAQQFTCGMVQSNSIASNCHVYCPTQRNIQAAAHLTSLASTPCAHSTTQQRVYQTEQSGFRPEAISTCFNIDEGLQEMGQPSFSNGPKHDIEWSVSHNEKHEMKDID